MTSSAAMNIKFHIARIYRSLGINCNFCLILHIIHGEMKKTWVGVFFWTQCIWNVIKFRNVHVIQLLKALAAKVLNALY